MTKSTQTSRTWIAAFVAFAFLSFGLIGPASAATYTLTPSTTTLSNWGQSVTLATDAPDTLEARVFLGETCSGGYRSEFQTVADIKKPFNFNDWGIPNGPASLTVCIFDSTDPVAVNSGTLTPIASATINFGDGDLLVVEASWPGFDTNYSPSSTPLPNAAPVVVSMTAPAAATAAAPYLVTSYVYFDLPQNVNPEIFKTPDFEADFAQPSYGGNLDTYGTLNADGVCVIHDVEIFQLSLTQVSAASPAFVPSEWSCNLFTFSGSNVGVSVYKTGGQIPGVQSAEFSFPAGILLQDSDETTLSWVQLDPYGVLEEAVVFSTPELAPNAPQKPTAVAGDSTATVTVAAASTGATPTSFTVTSNPDSKTCTIMQPSLSCVVAGLTNGTSYTFTATATNTGGTSAASLASDPVTPIGTDTDSPSSVSLVLSTPVGGIVAGSTATITATGLQSAAPYEITLRSEPQLLGSGFASAGAVNATVTIPAGLEAGWHSLTFSSKAANGSAVNEVLYFKISESGALVSSASVLPDELTKTGSTNYGFLMAAVIALGLGLALIAQQYWRRKITVNS